MNTLTPADLVTLTGYRRRADQLRWLRARGVEPFIGARGELTVFAGVLEEVQRRESGMELQASRRGPRPNLRMVT